MCVISVCFGQKGYVANYGEDTEYCGFNSSLPCRTLQHMVNRSDRYKSIYMLPDSSESVYDPGGDVLYYEPKSTLRLDGRLGKLILVARCAKSSPTVTSLVYLCAVQNSFFS